MLPPENLKHGGLALGRETRSPEGREDTTDRSKGPRGNTRRSGTSRKLTVWA